MTFCSPAFGHSIAQRRWPLYRSVAMDIPSLRASIRADLTRARSTLPDDSLSHPEIKEYQDHLSHNELELACEALEAYAKEHLVKACCKTPILQIRLTEASNFLEKSDLSVALSCRL